MYVVKPQSDRPVKIGYLGYDFTLQEADEHSANIVLASPSVTLATPSHFGGMDHLFVNFRSDRSFRYLGHIECKLQIVCRTTTSH